MLLQLIVRNVYSFRDETVFSLVSGEGAQPEQVVGIYGANASGKSNLVKALRVLRSMVAFGSDAGEPFEAHPFALDRSAAREASRIEVLFELAGHRHEYVLEGTKAAITHESLFRDDERVFVRNGSDTEFGEVWRDGTDYLTFVARGTHRTQPLLTEAATKNVPGAELLRRWFSDGLDIFTTQRAGLDIQRIATDSTFRRFLEEKLAAWGTGINGIEISRRPVSSTYRGILAGLGQNASDLGVAFNDVEDGTQEELATTLRHGPESTDAAIPFSDESDGTRHLLGLLPRLMETEHPRIIVIDELDRSLHAALTRRFVDDFREMNERTGRKSQLIFTSHDTTLLTGALKKPEELWFAEKDPTGASTLYSLADFKPEQIAALSKDLAQGYLSGRFGAVPFPISTGVPGWMRGTGS